MLCLGNRFSITKEYYEIQVKNSKEILAKYKINKKNEEDINKINNNDNNDTNTNTNIINNENNDINDINIKDKEKSINIIELDIERTFPYLGVFRGDSPMAQDLRE